MIDDAAAISEVEALRRCVRDMVALSTLPAIWSHARSEQIAESLAEIVVRMVAPDLVCVRINGDGEPVVRAVRSDGLPMEPALAARTLAALEPCLGGREATRRVPDPAGGGSLQLAVMPLGHQAETGVLAAAAARPGFPTDTDRLLLSVAANQAAVVLQRRRAEELLQRREGELADFFENAAVGLHLVGPDGTILGVNQTELDLLGYRREEYVGRNIAEFHVDPTEVEGVLRRLTAGETVRDLEARLRCKDGSIKHVLIDSNVKWENGRFVNTRSFTRDVTDRWRAEQTARFLADASATLAELTDRDSSLGRIARLAVPRFADWCWVDVADGEGLRRLTTIHDEPARLQLAQQLAEGYPARDTDPHGPGQVLGSGRTEWVPQVDDAFMVGLGLGPERLQLLRGLGLCSYLAVPVRSRSRLLGVLTFANAQSRRLLREDDLRAAEDLANRTAIAIENAALVQALTEADRRKDEFLAILAHELRNPLAPLRNAVEILRAKGPAKPELQWARGIIDRQAQQMSRLVDDLLDVSRISRGKIELRRERVGLAAVIGNALEASRPTVEKWGHQLTVVLPAEPLLVDADVVRIGQVLLNLLDNACKYTDRGGQIKLTVERDGGDAVIRVRDNGIGIPAEMLDSVFEMFTQVDRSLERAQGGLGIGLTLVHRLVGLHGGSVAVFSEGAGRGSEFVVRLPLATAAKPVEELEQPAERPRRPCRVLVVDDNQDSADSLAMLLEMLGDEVEVAYDGEAGVAAAAAFRPHVVVLDLGLPKLNGYEAARRMREQAPGTPPVLIALTGWGQEEDRQRSRDAGFDYHLTKPVDFQALKGLLAGLPRGAS